MEATLSQRMRQLANMPSGEPWAEELRAKADALEKAIDRAYSEEGTKDDVRLMLGCWARARRLWCYITGDDLV